MILLKRGVVLTLRGGEEFDRLDRFRGGTLGIVGSMITDGVRGRERNEIVVGLEIYFVVVVLETFRRRSGLGMVRTWFYLCRR